jgi:hypothetical protein
MTKGSPPHAMGRQHVKNGGGNHKNIGYIEGDRASFHLAAKAKALQHASKRGSDGFIGGCN